MFVGEERQLLAQGPMRCPAALDVAQLLGGVEVVVMKGRMMGSVPWQVPY